MVLQPWVAVGIALGALLAVFFFSWRYIRRGTTPLHRAAAKGNVARIEQLLLVSPRSVNSPDAVGLIPLEYAAHWGHLDAVRFLLDHGADIGAAGRLTPLHRAAAEGHKDIVLLLLERAADIDAKASSDHSTPLHSAVIQRRADMAALLLARGADVEARTKSDWTPCHFAAAAGDEQTMTVLLDHNADWQALNSANQNPLELALANGHRSIVRLVRERQKQPPAGGQ